MTKTMAEVLDEHVQSARNQRCSCGWRGDVSKSIIDPQNIHWQHRRHVAEALSAAGYGLVQEAQARAYDKGYGHGRQDGTYHPPFSGNPRPQKSRRNPYRKASNDNQ